MEFRIKKVVLESLLTKAASVLSTGDIMPILKHFQVQMRDKNLVVVATDLELSVIAKTQLIEKIDSGRAVFPGKKFLDIVKEAEDGVMTISVDKDEAGIVCMGTSWNIKLMNADEYPPIPNVKNADFIQVGRTALANAIGIVKGAAAKESIRPALQMVSVSGGKICASDGAVFRQVETPELAELDTQIPIGAVDDLLKLLRNTEMEQVSIGQTEDHLVFVIDGDAFIITKTNVDYPDVESGLLAIARNNEQRLTVDRQQLVNGIKRVRVTADEETRALVLDLSEHKLVLRAKDKYGNFATQVLDVFWEDGEKKLGVNHEYMLDLLTVLPSASISILLGEDVKTRKAPLFIIDDKVTAVLQQLAVAV